MWNYQHLEAAIPSWNNTDCFFFFSFFIYTLKDSCSVLRLSFKCRNILCKSDPPTPHPPFSTVGLWYFTISFTCRLSHSLWFPPDVLQCTFPDCRDWDMAYPGPAFPFPFLFCWQIHFFLSSLLARRGFVWRYLSHWWRHPIPNLCKLNGRHQLCVPHATIQSAVELHAAVICHANGEREIAKCLRLWLVLTATRNMFVFEKPPTPPPRLPAPKAAVGNQASEITWFNWQGWLPSNVTI